MTRLALLLAATLALPVNAQAPAMPPAAPQSKEQISLSFSPVVKAAAPAVVNIYASRVVERRFSPFRGDPFFDQMFRDFAQVRPEVQNSLGSGVIVSANGLVVSNYHVVEAATEIKVVLGDKREFVAEVVLSDRDNDLAVLRLKDAKALPVLKFRDSDGVEVGDLVLAIGNPFGLGQTVSMGIVSALARSVGSVGDGRGYFLQTDAAINPGNSGGALVDGEGRLVGINTAIFTQSGGSNGVGFAIPSNLVRSVVQQAEAGAKVFSRPWAGLVAQSVDGALAEGLGQTRPEGVILSEVHPDSPFAAEGLKAGDVILRVDGAAVNSPNEMLFRMSSRGIGQRIKVEFFREGEVNSLGVALIAPPEKPARDPVTLGQNSVLQGLSVARINPAVIAEFDLPQNASGILVTDSQDWGAQAGLRRGDILLSINGKPIVNPKDVEAATQVGPKAWQIDLQRGGKPLRLRLRS